MKRTYFSVLLRSIFILACINGAAANNVNEHHDNSGFSSWTDERLREYNDSLKDCLYPVLETDSMIISEDHRITFSERDGEGVAKLVRSGKIPEIVTVDLSKEVGDIPIRSGVSQTGAKTYEVPIEVYPGMNGMTPRLALSYNSQRGSGTLGSGWALSGLPMITRGKRTLYYDGETREERMDTTDSFYLDGVRLIKTGVATGYIVYQTETGNIKAKGYVSGKNLKYFEVFYPDGKKGTFGSSSNYTSKFQYPVMQMKDLHGNTVEYRYLETDNIYRISSIQYNGYGGTVYFSYETNPNPVTMYAAGKKISHGYRISNISCRFGSSALRNYVLKYETYNNTTLLTEIGMTSGERSVNPLRFYYGAGKDATGFYKSDTRLTHWFKDVKPSDIKVVKGKFDYESGVEGIIIYPSFNPYFKFYGKDGNTGTRYSIFKNYISEDVKIFFYSGLKESDYSYPMPTLTTGKGFIDILCADLEGSQEESVIKVNNYVDAGKDRVVFTVYQKSAISGLIKKYERIFDFNTVYSNGQNQCVMPKFFYAGDFTGDGKMEILAVSAQDPLGISPSSFGTRCYLFDIEGNRLLYSDHGFEYVVEFVGTELTDGQAAYDKSDKLIPADYNGDGKTDICLVKSIGTVTYSFEKTAGGYELKPIANYTGLKKENLLYRDILFGEFNGDGLMDILISPTWNILSDSTWKVLYSKGDGQFESKSFSGIKNSNDQNIGFLLHDYDGDGKTDLVRYDSKGFDIYKWNGKSFSDNSVRTENASEDFKIVPTNLVSHNSFIRLIAIKDNTATKYLWPVNEGVETLVSGAANSSGIVEKTEYAMIDGSDTEFYLMDNKAQFPFVNIQEQLPVVFKTETRHGNAIAEQNTYRYENAVIHRQGLGFAGFSKTEVRNNRNQTLTHTYDPFNHSIPKGESGPGYEKNYMFRISVSSDKILRCDLTEKLEKDKLKGNSVKTTFTYDAYGYPVTEKSVFSDGTEIYKENTYLANTEVADGYYLGYKTGEKNTIKKDGKANTDNEVISSSDKMLPLVRYREKDGNRTEEITYTYDIHGNLSSETLKKYASVNLQKTQYVYDRYGRLTKKTDPLGRSTSYVYDALGRLGSETDFRRGKTEYGYDSFGRTVTTTYPDNTKDSVSYTWNSSVAGGLYVINSYSTGKPDKKEYYDARNRLIRSSELRFDGSYISVDRRYDGYGRLEKISLPFKGTVASYWNVNAYDSYDRQISQTEASGNKTTWSYSGNSVTTVMNKISTTKTYDARENLISVKDASGTVTYSYAPDGRLLSVTAPGNIVTSLTYDGYGRKISMTDPSSGTTTYSYDDDGNLSSQTDAEGKEISHEYDSYGRLLKTVSPGYSTSCTYDNNGDLTTVVTNGMTKTIEYDSLGRISKTKEFSIESKFLTKTYGYSDGSLTAIAYDSPTGRLGVEVREYENGHLRSIKYNGSHEIYRLDSENEFGQPTKVTTWDITREYTFSQYGYPTGRKFSKGSYVYQDFGYVFDPLTGNLTSRTDRKRNKTENFAYDGLNRLSTYDGNTVSYESNGNITRRSDVGSFTYSRADKPYALTGASAEESRIPTRQQDITYTAFGRPETISENRTTYSFVYNGDYDRVGMYKILGEQSVKAMVYLGGNYEADINVRTSVRSSGYGYEEMSYAEKLFENGQIEQAEGDDLQSEGPKRILPSESDIIEERLYLGGGYYDSPIVLVKKDNKIKFYHVFRDYLGSITMVVDNEGMTGAEYSYDAWGNMRNPSTHEVYKYGEHPALLLGRGYTGHEHLKPFGLINMNARLYDPALGRFLSPDPLVQMPDMLQNFNRYSYCLNNPLCYVDEDGEFFWFIVGAAAIISGVTNVIVHLDEISAAGGGWDSLWRGAAYFGVGAVAGGVSAAAGVGMAVGLGHIFSTTAAGVALYSTGIGPGAACGAVSGGVGGFLDGSLNSLVDGNSFSHAIRQGGKGALAGAITGAITGGIDGGTLAYQNKKNIWSGEMTKDRAIYRAGEFANDFVDDVGHVGGTKKHKVSEVVLTKIGKKKGWNDLLLEKRYHFENSSKYIIPDVWDLSKNIIYDYKFGYPNVTIQQLLNYQKKKYKGVVYNDVEPEIIILQYKP